MDRTSNIAKWDVLFKITYETLSGQEVHLREILTKMITGYCHTKIMYNIKNNHNRFQIYIN
jgi:hypothetical protein